GSARFSTWLYRVAMNLCLDRIAKKRETTTGELPDVVDPEPGPSASFDAADLAGRVRAALATLPPTQRMAVALWHYPGMRNGEAAEILEVSVEALESLLARARRALRARLRDVAPALLGEG